MLTRIFVLEGTADHAIDVALGGQGNRPGDRRTGALSRLDDLRSRLVELLVVIALEANSDLVLWQAYGSWLMGEISERRNGAASTSPAFNASYYSLFDDLGDCAGAHGSAAFANREAETLIHGDRLDQLDLHVRVVARHDHFLAVRQLDRSRHVRRAEVELRPVAVEERRVAPTLVLGEDVDAGHEVGVRSDRARLGEHLSALDVLALDTAQ